jgi:hypothetical protein
MRLTDEQKHKDYGWGIYLFLIAAFTLLLLPSIGMFWARSDNPIGNETQREWPKIRVEDTVALHVGFLKDAGDYFESRFAYRPHMISANARLYYSLLKTSPTKDVIIGTDGWLFSGSTANDFTQINTLSPRSIQNIAHNVSLMQEYAESRNARFALIIAPNKNTIYPQYMPYYYQAAIKSDSPSNLELLLAALAEAGVTTVDYMQSIDQESLGTTKSDSEQPIYHKTDTHWNARGAHIAASDLLAIFGKSIDSIVLESDSVTQEYPGDLHSLLYPPPVGSEEHSYVDFKIKESAFSFVREDARIGDFTVETKAPSREGRLVMYQDSFGDALIPFLANEFEQTYCSKMIPYDFGAIDKNDATAVVVVRAERQISFLGQTPPVMENPVRDIVYTIEKDSHTLGSFKTENKTSLSLIKNGPYFALSGIIDSRYHNPDTKIYVSVVEPQSQIEVTREAFHVSLGEDDSASDWGYLIYLNKSSLPPVDFEVRIIISQKGTAKAIAIETLKQSDLPL